MILNKTDVRADVVEFVRLGARVCSDYHVDIPNYPTFQAAMAVTQGGNNFDPERVARTFRELDDDVMQVEFGAEGSPVLYVHLPFWTHQRRGATSCGSGEKYTDEQRRQLAARVIAWARQERADEISTHQFPSGDEVWNASGEQPHRIRIWWD